jgi:signal transduction histidine kinase
MAGDGVHPAAGEMAHELRTPLAKIRMYTEMLLLRRESSEEERVRWLETIEREACRLGQCVDNLVLVAEDARRSGRYPARAPLDLGALLEDAVADLALSASTLGVSLAVDPLEGVIVSAERTALTQAITNLLDDAISLAMPGEEVAVTLGTDADEATVRISLAGQSLAASDARVARASRREREDRSPFRLTATRVIVEAHGGSCRVEPRTGGLPSVAVTLPTAPA